MRKLDRINAGTTVTGIIFGGLFCILAFTACTNGKSSNAEVKGSTAAEQTKTNEKTMTLSRPGSRPASPGPEQNFTGAVSVEPVFPVSDPSRVSAGRVTFEPGARSAWHTHPLGQTLVITSGSGWTQVEGGPKEEIRAGDVVWCPPNTRHWHGATSTTSVTHIAVQESLNGSPVNWMEKVSDEVYAASK
jgi:quercetin dioxygenase-like cupin family protein